MSDKFRPNASAMLIGSQPLKEHKDAHRLVLEYTPDIPNWVQLPAYRNEGMVDQFMDARGCEPDPVLIVFNFFGNANQHSYYLFGLNTEDKLKDNAIRFANQLNDVQKQDIIKILGGVAKDVAEELNIPLNLIRSNLFGIDSQGRMRMLREMTFNMDREEEFTISMPVGYGSTGRCFQSGSYFRA